jgi:hypothetical protein
VSALALSASPALATVHPNSFDISGEVLVCGANTYTITSGTVSDFGGFVGKAFVETRTPRDVMAEDAAGNVYSIVGSTTIVRGHAFVTFIVKLQIIGQGGGTADSVNRVVHFNDDGFFKGSNSGTCDFFRFGSEEPEQ